MAEGGSESEGLGIFVKKHNKYGTTTKSIYTNDTFRKYIIEPRDTLQGIALKCGATMEVIKRANNIWTNDSLYLREYLLIPVVSKIVSNGLSEINDNNQEQKDNESAKYEIVTRQDIITAQKKIQNSRSCSSALSTICECPNATSAKDFLSRFDNNLAKIKTSVQKLEGETKCECPKSTTAKDFLSKYDNKFEKIKTNVQKLEGQPSFTEEDGTSNPLTLLPKKRTQYGARQKRHSLESDSAMFLNDTTAEPDLLIISSNRNGRANNIRTSLEQLQKTEEDLFQL